MWICQNNSFLSVVANPDDASTLVVRARRNGDIEAVFGGAYPVITIPGRDYQFRAIIPRAVVGEVIVKALMEIGYSNFKGSVKDRHLHDAYQSVWWTMSELQEVVPYGKLRPGFSKHPQRVKR
jgi:hypothetical protein